jgi:SAM-dependent methyltransferase
VKADKIEARRACDAQREHWESTLGARPQMFGESPSCAARKALELFHKEGAARILDLGAGQGRDTLYFARGGLDVHAVDYAESGLHAIEERADALALSSRVTALRHDLRRPLPFGAETFDGCYSHMLYCMAFTTRELESLSAEIRRVLKPGGINFYTVRHTGDPNYGKGTHRGEDMYEAGGFIVHFFSREKVALLAEGFEILGIEEFEEGKLPRKLLAVGLRKTT